VHTISPGSYTGIYLVLSWLFGGAAVFSVYPFHNRRKRVIAPYTARSCLTAPDWQIGVDGVTDPWPSFDMNLLLRTFTGWGISFAARWNFNCLVYLDPVNCLLACRTYTLGWGWPPDVFPGPISSRVTPVVGGPWYSPGCWLR